MNKAELRSKAKAIEPLIRIGKNGLSDHVVQEIKKLLNKKKLIKVKILKSALTGRTKKELAKCLVAETNAELIDAIGFIVVLAKK